MGSATVNILVCVFLGVPTHLFLLGVCVGIELRGHKAQMCS